MGPCVHFLQSHRNYSLDIDPPPFMGSRSRPNFRPVHTRLKMRPERIPWELPRSTWNRTRYKLPTLDDAYPQLKHS